MPAVTPCVHKLLCEIINDPSISLGNARVIRFKIAEAHSEDEHPRAVSRSTSVHTSPSRTLSDGAHPTRLESGRGNE